MHSIPFSLPGFALTEVISTAENLIVCASSLRTQAACPACYEVTQRVHSYYQRSARDLPTSGRAVQLRLRVRRFRCLNTQCSKKTFAEPLPDLIAPVARRTNRLSILWYVFALQSGGEPGARLLKAVGTKVSPDTLLRLAKATMAPHCVVPSILGVDDFAFRRGLKYGTLLIDWERHRPVDLLPDRTAETFAAWLRAHPGVKWISRDRSGEYARGAQLGAPSAQQVMDRWHVIKNWREALERVMHRVYPRLKQRQEQPRSTPFPRRKKPRTLHEQAVSDASRQLRLTHYEEVLACYQQGLPITQIARQLHLSRGTIYRYLTAEHFPERSPRAPSAGSGKLIAPYTTYLRERCAQGCQNAQQLAREIQEIKGGENVPSYVLEYLLGRYCASDDPEEIRLGIEAVKDTLHRNYFRHDEANKAQSFVEQLGKYRFIDRIEVRFLPSEGKYWAAMDHFSYSRIHVSERFYRSYERLLEGGIWAIVDLEYRNEGGDDDEQRSKSKGSPFYITDLRPIQLARLDFEEFCEGRRAFTTDQWIDALVRSAGLEPTQMERRLKLLLLARFLPFVEKNFNFIELGPRGTGKSYVFSEMSPYGILISGGKASSANLFYNNARRQVGLVGHWDVVAFDEVGGMKVQDPDTIQIMKDYMANGRFSRGITQVLADAALVFVGNLNQSVETLVQNAATDLFQPLSKEFDLAVMDRLHFYLPGWEIPKTSKALLSTHYGFVTDYLSEAFRALRKQNRYDALDQRFHLGSHVEGRDATAVRKTVSGLLKILHPDGTPTSEELQEYLELALEGRRRIKEQLKKRGAFEFYKTSFSYIDLTDGIERTVGVPEQGAKGVISQDPLPPGNVYTATADGESHVALYRLEVTLTAGTGKLRTPAGMEHGLKESLNRAWSYLKVVQDRLGLSPMLAQKDLVAEAIDLSGGHIECACGVAFLVAMLSALGQRRIQAGTVVLGDLTIQGNIKGLPSITEILQMALENGALRVLLPTGNKIHFSSLPEEVVEKMDLIFYSDVDRAITKAVEM